MVKLLTLCSCLVFALMVSAQSDSAAYKPSSGQTETHKMSDYISVRKKNGITVRNFYAGMDIHFTGTDGFSYDGPIDAIARDTVFLASYKTSRYQNILGYVVTDTLRKDIIPFYYKNIRMIYIIRGGGRQSPLVPLGGAMVLGGLGYDIVNIANASRDKVPVFKGENLTRLGIATAAAIAGFGILKKSTKNARARNRYRIVYVDMQ